jgi:hypothetical protein
MRLILRLDPNRLRRWHLRLVDRLTKRSGVELGVQWVVTGEKVPSALALLFTLERLVYRLLADGIAAEAEAGDLARFVDTRKAGADLVLDFTGGIPRAGERTWHITFDGVASETAALAAIAEWRTPVVSIKDASSGAEIVTGHPGTESAGVFVLAFEDVLARTSTLVIAALDDAGARHVDEAPRATTLSTKSVARYAVRSLAMAIVRRLYHLCYNAPHWRVGWRFVDGDDIIDRCALPSGGWRNLPDDGLRFYADPFPVAKNGSLYVFVEEFPHRLGRGLISVVAFNEAGPIGTPRPVLETNGHLSYPFVFEHGGDMWMVPETCASETIDLYRAVEFPDRWVKEATLVAGIAASDATLFEHDGRWWMLATVRDGGGAYSDALHIWSAPQILGPWQPHRRNPVLVDIANARSAGRVVRRGGRLVRPVQDCRGGYGAALGLAEITQLDDDGFAQRVMTYLRPGPLWPGRRLHTLNRAGQLECIDGSASSRRF